MSSANAPTPENKLLFQCFEWHSTSEPPKADQTRSEQSHFSRLARLLPKLSELGVTALYLPPGCKANDPLGNGYDCYDIWDLGEFDQKGSRSCKWGSREDLQDLIDTAKKLGGVELIWDAVLNHKTSGDALEETWAVEVDNMNRLIEVTKPRKIDAWLKYNFPGREAKGMPYSKFKWRAEHFNGVDWDQTLKKTATYKLIDDPATYPDFVLEYDSEGRSIPSTRPGKGWRDDVDKTLGNFDYLMFCNIWHPHPEVVEDLTHWGQWMLEEVGVHGFRLDAVKHFSSEFTQKWIADTQTVSNRVYGKNCLIVGEIWDGANPPLLKWLDIVAPAGSETHAAAFDVPLLYNFSHISEDVRHGHAHADLRTILTGTGGEVSHSLMKVRPHQAVTFITSHDTQPGQSSFTPMDASLKALFYAFILLRQEGLPCVFWGDTYGTKGPQSELPACQVLSRPGPDGSSEPPKTQNVLPALMLARKLYAYGAQDDHFDSASCIGWTRAGTHDRPGCAVLMSIAQPTDVETKRMKAGKPGERWVDVLDDEKDKSAVTLDAEGFGEFACRGRSVSVWVSESAPGLKDFPVEFFHDAYAQ